MDQSVQGIQRRIRQGVTVAVFGAWLVSPTAAEEPADPFQERVLPVLETYCFDCHSEIYAEAGIVLDRYADEAAAFEDSKTWFRVRNALEGRIMPPVDMPQPSLDELEAVVTWIEQDYVAAQADGTSAPVVIRRLNRRQYDNTVRDLLGLELRLSELFPADEISFGFDTIGSALSVSPIHVEKYLEAAERALSQAIQAPDVEGFAPIELIGLRTYPLPWDEAVTFEHRLRPGRYLVDFSLVRVGIPETVPPPRLVIGLGSDARAVQAARTQDETSVYRLWLTVADGDNQAAVSLALGQSEEDVFGSEVLTATTSGDQRYGNDRGLHVDSMVVRGPLPVEPADLPASHRQLVFQTPELGDDSRLETARAVIGRFTERAFRRPVEPEEVEEVMAIFRLAHDRGESFERALQIALSSVLISPKFLYLFEPQESPQERPLTDFELASRLSYFLWSSMPDEELFEQARHGTLRDNLAQQVDRMLDDPKAESFVEDFVGQWLQLRELTDIARDPDRFPSFNDTLRDAMLEETEAYVAHVLRDNRSVLELLDSDYTFVNEPLARHYGIEGVRGEAFRRVKLASNETRGGVLTQASVLTLTSHPNRTSPVKRGKWILQQLLGTPPPPPPPDVPDLEEDTQSVEAASLRERLELHRASPDCASCHQQMDPLGFALENYDAIGRWRTKDGPFPIDASGELSGGLQVEGAADLRAVLRETESYRKKFTRTLIENLMTYGLGRGLEPQDYATVQTVGERLVEDDYRIRAIIRGIVESRAFQYRGVAEDS